MEKIIYYIQSKLSVAPIRLNTLDAKELAYANSSPQQKGTKESLHSIYNCSINESLHSIYNCSTNESLHSIYNCLEIEIVSHAVFGS